MHHGCKIKKAPGTPWQWGPVSRLLFLPGEADIVDRDFEP